MKVVAQAGITSELNFVIAFGDGLCADAPHACASPAARFRLLLKRPRNVERSAHAIIGIIVNRFRRARSNSISVEKFCAAIHCFRAPRQEKSKLPAEMRQALVPCAA